MNKTIVKDDVNYDEVKKVTLRRGGTSIKKIMEEFKIDFLRAKNFYRRLVVEKVIYDSTGQLVKKRGDNKK